MRGGWLPRIGVKKNSIEFPSVLYLVYMVS